LNRLDDSAQPGRARAKIVGADRRSDRISATPLDHVEGHVKIGRATRLTGRLPDRWPGRRSRSLLKRPITTITSGLFRRQTSETVVGTRAATQFINDTFRKLEYFVGC
jgi:hypothetical protein